MNDLDGRLRQAAATARSRATAAIDLERDLAATIDRAQSSTDVQVAEGHQSRRPSGVVLAVAAALLVVVSIGAILVVRGDDSSRHVTITPPPETGVVVTPPPTIDESPPTVVPPPTSSLVPSGSTTVSTAPPTTTPAIAPTTAPSVSSGGSVSYLDPPPSLPLQNIGATELASRDGENWIDVAVGESGVAVNQSWAGYVTVIGYDGDQHDVAIDGSLGQIVYGPGDVVYGLRGGDAIEDFAMVAVALAGDSAGTTVASTPLPIVRYTELPTGAFGHGTAGIVDREREVNTTVSEYVGVDGSLVTWDDPEPALMTAADDDLTISDSLGHSWKLSIEASPVAASSYVGPSPPAPTNNGDAVYWTFVGPNARPDQDFGLQTMPVIAALHPDGTVTWWSVPAGWQVVASDVWGTVLARLNGQRLDLAMADFSGEGGQAPTPTGCLGGVASRDVAHVFLPAMLAARESGSLDAVSTCLSTIPEAFTGMAPACWSACTDATRTIAPDSLTTSLGASSSGAQFVFASISVSYRTATGHIDVLESWQFTPTEDGYEVSDFTIQEPPFDRDGALATIAEYFDVLEAQDWLAAAAMLDDGAINPEERVDLQRLRPDDFTLEGVAAALARWCEFGCDTVVPTADELDFSGSLGLTRNGERIQVAWFEGVYSIVGLPFQTLG